MIIDTIPGEITKALKAANTLRLSTLRMLLSALNYELIAKQHRLSEEEELQVVKKEAKKRRDAIEAYQKSSDVEKARERIEKEQKELEILKEYLPAEMPSEELEKLVDDAIAKTGASAISDMGKVIGLVMSQSKGAADGAKVAELARKRLES